MARDDMARDSDSEQSLLDRRSHLRLADAAAATVAESGMVPADETEHCSPDDDSAVEVQDGS